MAHRDGAAARAQKMLSGRPPSFLGGFGLSLVNPKGYAAMAALFSGFVLLRERLALDAGGEDRVADDR